MKTILVLSVLLNAVLIVLIGRQLRMRSIAGVALEVAPPTAKDGGSVKPVSVHPPRMTTTNAAWAWVESRDLGRLMANLRVVGCPEQTIQDIACLRLCREYRQKLIARTAVVQGQHKVCVRFLEPRGDQVLELFRILFRQVLGFGAVRVYVIQFPCVLVKVSNIA